MTIKFTAFKKKRNEMANDMEHKQVFKEMNYN